ncbi:hypothetical protein CANMA_004454 [Candida margitis]|uniref:uncharacterized protein n=1 Tax=Candida margitis TaxID=1775924 RepID=UPI0022277F20|nr:uncharacterized protein CANMA_004454 [Candida margitis]KAI5957041.1 hypothetical protein CANMA_004454 [Candida margitis]
MTLFDIITSGTSSRTRFTHEYERSTSKFNLAANFKRQVVKFVHHLKSVFHNDYPEEEEDTENASVSYMSPSYHSSFTKSCIVIEDLVFPGLNTCNATAVTPVELMLSGLCWHVMKNCNATGYSLLLELNAAAQQLDTNECLVQSNLRIVVKSPSHALPMLPNSTTVGSLDSYKQRPLNEENSVESGYIRLQNEFRIVVENFFQNLEHTVDKYQPLLNELEQLRREESEITSSIERLISSVRDCPGKGIFTEEIGALMTEYEYQGQEAFRRLLLSRKELVSCEAVEKFLASIMSLQVSQELQSSGERHSDGPSLKWCNVRKNIYDFEFRNSELGRREPRMLADIKDNIVEAKAKLAASKVLVDVYSTILDVHKKCEKHKFKKTIKRTRDKFMKLLSEDIESVKRIVGVRESTQGYKFEIRH